MKEILTDMLGETVLHSWGKATLVTSIVKAIYFKQENGVDRLIFLVHNMGNGNLQEVPAEVCSMEV